MSLTEIEHLIAEGYTFQYNESLPILATYAEQDLTTFTFSLAVGMASADPDMDSDDVLLVEKLITRGFTYNPRVLHVLAYLFEHIASSALYGELPVFDVVSRVNMLVKGYSLEAVLNLPTNYDIDDENEEWFSWYNEVIETIQEFIGELEDEGIDYTSVDFEEFPELPPVPSICTY